MPQPPSITLIAGPTASGKSALALKMARETGAVIINADSQQLYADLRILTARPSEENEALADHRLYGVADAADAWSVGRWSRAVLGLLEELRADGRPAILVGGTGLYFMALTKGLAEIPPVPAEIRDAVEASYIEDGEDVFRARLAKIDPDAARSIEQGDRQRLVRAMSVFVSSGRSLNMWRLRTRPLLAPGSWTGLIVEPERSSLYDNCDRRAELMVSQGVLSEVSTLNARGLNAGLPAMKAVGLRELTRFLSGEASLAASLEAVKRSTRNYAKRQSTWFRNQNPGWLRERQLTSESKPA